MELPDIDRLYSVAYAWVELHMLNVAMGAQLGWILFSLLAGLIIARRVSPRLQLLYLQYQPRWFSPLIHAVQSVLSPFFSLLVLSLYPFIAQMLDGGTRLFSLSFNLLGAWVLIRFASAFIRYPALARWLAIIIWTAAVLSSFGMLMPALEELDNLGFAIGEKRISILTVLRGVMIFGVMLWAAMVLSRVSETRIQQVKQLTPSLRVLIGKIIRTLFVIFACLIGLNTLGIDMTSLAVFSGAVGVGLGFGLQKVVSNFISGIILLLDRSIKPGDVIAVDDTYGWVNRLGARHVSVVTRDGKEHLIPNELLITERVENWSYSDSNLRLKIPIGIAYHSDPRLALTLMLEAADETKRILKHPKPNALLIGFGDNSIGLELRAWIADPANGIRNISSELLLAIWDKFQSNGIDFPFPQRDVHLDSSAPLRIKLEQD